jgi:hypothetical protein
VLCRDVEILCQDAAQFVPLEDPLFIFLFNPFDAKIVRRVAENLVNSRTRTTRHNVVYYVWAEHPEVWESAGFRIVHRHRSTVVLEFSMPHSRIGDC